MAEQENPILLLKDVKLHFPVGKGKIVKAVDGVSFTLRAGETLGLVGESGCGKTSLARVLLHLYKPTSGQVIFEGVDWFSAQNSAQGKLLRRSIQMVFQDPFASLDPRQTIGSAIMEPLLVAGVARAEARKRAEYLLERVGLSHAQMFKYPHEFSGGQLQRVAIARALVLQPKVIIADEPVSALDVSIRAQVLNLFKELQKEMNLALIFISHDLSLVRYMSHKIAVMYLGRFVEYGDAETICAQPAHPYTEMLIRSVPDPNPERKLALEKFVPQELPSPLNVPPGCAFHTRCSYVMECCKKNYPPALKLDRGTEVCCYAPR